MPQMARVRAFVRSAREIAFAEDPAWPEPVAGLARTDALPSDLLTDEVRDAASKLHGVSGPFTAVIPVPSRSHPQRVTGVAKAATQSTSAPAMPLVQIRGPAPNRDVASLTLVQHLEAELRVKPHAELPTAGVRIVDDTAGTTWTLTIGRGSARRGRSE